MKYKTNIGKKSKIYYTIYFLYNYLIEQDILYQKQLKIETLDRRQLYK